LSKIQEKTLPLFVITGASGSGKSSLIEALQRRGLTIQQEIGREIVRQQTACGGRATPWDDRLAFRDMLFAQSVTAFDAHYHTDPAKTVFFDRSFIEAIAYSDLIGEAVSESMQKHVGTRCFANPVFVCPPWKEIFIQDEERRHGFAFAVQDFEANIEAYSRLGYELLEVPKMSVKERADFVIDALH